MKYLVLTVITFLTGLNNMISFNKSFKNYLKYCIRVEDKYFDSSFVYRLPSFSAEYFYKK